MHSLLLCVCSKTEIDVVLMAAYAWVECKRKEDKNCEEVFRVAKIIGCPGRKFLAEDRHVRLSLLKSQHDFDMLIHRLKELVSQEYEASAQAMSSF